MGRAREGMGHSLSRLIFTGRGTLLKACGQTARRETDSGTENSLREFRRELLRYMMMAFFGQTSAQVPQPTQASSSRTQVLAARSSVSAPAGHLRAQIVQ